ncbi:hypothetical protein R1sor_007815 [Riccia sorocarpa]|uniref:Uncharacterized protein n=1 Tax=Riccia sorocarpa TaxID=122646 RepID=A0ABD3HTY7_9MARC
MEGIQLTSDGQKDWMRKRLLEAEDVEPEKAKSSKEKQFKEMIKTLADRIAQVMGESSHSKQKRSSKQNRVIEGNVNDGVCKNKTM